MDKFLREIKNKITPVFKRYDIIQAAIFGSYARNNYKKGSDIDILIKFKKGKEKSLLQLVRIKYEIERLLKKR